MSALLQSTVCIAVLAAGVAAPLTAIPPDPVKFDDGLYSAKRIDRQVIGDMTVGLMPSDGAEARLAVLTLYLLRKTAPAAMREPAAEQGGNAPINPADLLPVLGTVTEPRAPAAVGITLVGQVVEK